MLSKRSLLKLAAFVVALVSQAAQADVASPQTIEERADGSDTVAVVGIESVKSEKIRNHFGDELIVTRAKLRTKERMKGKQDPADLIVEGGTVDGLTLKVSDQPVLKEGDEAVVFLNNTEDGVRPHARGQGVVFLEKGTSRVRNSSLDVARIREKVRNTLRSK
jgi:hypothetical protein